MRMEGGGLNIYEGNMEDRGWWIEDRGESDDG